MSATPPGPGWWLASDGKWYPPNEPEAAPGPGWWLASDGRWYPPREHEQPPAPGWWLASDGKWYPPQTPPPAEEPPVTVPADPATKPSTKPARLGRSKVKGPRWRGRRKDEPKRQEPAEPSSTATPEPAGASEFAVPAAAPPATPFESNPFPDRVRPNVNEGLSPEEQIRRRDLASRADAQVLRAKRSEAASRALGALQAELASLGSGRAATSTLTAPSPERAPVAEPPVAPAATPTAVPTAPTPAPAPRPVQPEAEDEAPGEPPLLEVKSSAINADLEHLGDRLAIFTDRVELRDRLDRLRQAIRGEYIFDVTVQKNLTGVVLTIHSARGQGMVVKSLRADQAEEARQLIMRKTRPIQPVRDEAAIPTPPAVRTDPPAPTPTPTAAPTPAPAPPPRPKLDQADLLAKLADLHRAGILTDDEFAQKTDLIARLVRLEQLAPTR